MIIKEFVSKYIDCKICTRKCCNAIDGSAFIGTDENVPKDKIDEEINFFSSENEKCIYFKGSLCSIYGGGMRPFLCKVYPFRIVGNKLFIDEWCMYGKEIPAAIKENDLDLIKDLRSLRGWMAGNVPQQLANFWESKHKGGKYSFHLGVELIIK